MGDGASSWELDRGLGDCGGVRGEMGGGASSCKRDMAHEIGQATEGEALQTGVGRRRSGVAMGYGGGRGGGRGEMGGGASSQEWDRGQEAGQVSGSGAGATDHGIGAEGVGWRLVSGTEAAEIPGGSETRWAVGQALRSGTGGRKMGWSQGVGRGRSYPPVG